MATTPGAGNKHQVHALSGFSRDGKIVKFALKSGGRGIYMVVRLESGVETICAQVAAEGRHGRKQSDLAVVQARN
jgi:hypothetical protein